MKRLLEAILLGCVALLPAAALAQYPTSVWSSPFSALPARDGVGTPVRPPFTPNTDLGQARDYKIPFDFRFNGVEYGFVNIGAKGYVTFGVSQANSTSPAILTQPTNEPKNLAAVWWGDHFCDLAGGGIQVQEAGAEPNRRLIIQWDCSRKVNNAASSTKFRAQLILFEMPEGSTVNNVIRASYGNAIIGSGDWTSLSWGLRFDNGGQMGPPGVGKVACTPAGSPPLTPKCTGATHFPTDSVIQYGRFVEPDLTGAIEVTPSNFAVFPTWVEVSPSVTVRNNGLTAAPNVTYDVYLAESAALGPSAAFKIGRHTPPFFVDMSGEVAIPDFLRSTSRPVNKLYYVCVHIDPDNAIAEADETNNWVCTSTRVTLGPDLTGTITAPATGEAKAVVNLPVSIINKGTEDAGAIAYHISMVPVDPGSGEDVTFYEEDVYDGVYSAGLAAGETVNFVVTTELPRVIRADKYWFKLYLDPEKLIADANPFDNTVLSTGQMTNRKPKVEITQSGTNGVKVTLPYGCYYGQPMFAQYQLCNTGLADAKGFRTGVAMGNQNSPSLNDDPGTVTVPQYCGQLDNPDSFNRQYCLPVGDVMPECHYEYCIIPCEPQTDQFCRSIGMECLYDESWMEDFQAVNQRPSPTPLYSCQLSLPKPSPGKQCITVTAAGVIPRADRRERAPYQPGPQRFFVIDDIDLLLSEDTPAIFSTDPYDCYESLADFTATNLAMPHKVVAGEPITVERSIKNVKFIELKEGQVQPDPMVSVEYGYYLSRSRDDISVNQIFAKVKSTNGYGVATVGSISNKFRNEDRRPELIVIPPEIQPGTYYVGIILDPRNQFRELDKENNLTVLDHPVVVEGPSLRIVSEGPPTTVLHSKVTYQFVSMGGIGLCRWTADSVPPGLSLNSAGILEGKAVEIGEFFFRVRVACGDLTASRPYVLRVVGSLGSLEVITSTLPPGRVGTAYGEWFDDLSEDPHHGVQLAASGGNPPYKWSYLEDRAPNGIVLTPEGILQGSPTTNSASRSFTVQVEDADGNKASRELRIEILQSETMTFNRDTFKQALAGTVYIDCVTVSGGSNTTQYEFFVEGIPPGLAEQNTSVSVCLAGFPSKVGNYRVRVTATDAAGQSISRSLPLTVEAYQIHVNNRSLRAVHRGDTVHTQLTTNGTGKVDFALVSGSLPDGLSLSKDGVISGTVSKDADFGAYNFSVHLVDEGGRSGETPLTMAVIVELRDQVVEVETKSGCSSSGSMDLSLLGLALAGLAAFRRRGEAR